MVLQELGHARITLLDASAEMLARAKGRLQENDDHRFLLGDFSKELPEGKFDAIVSALAIHHLSHQHKRNLFRMIFDALPPGGVFLNVEQLAGSSEVLENFYDEAHETHVNATKTPSEEWRRGRERMKYDIPASLETQLGWLKSIGFREVDCLAKDCRFATYVATR
jgi:tRNA (cmo5U34)-methyltransferase